ncbi:hypothetical protein [Guptibacillus hwajinpoensis]|uniref:hypothetical protein n=1 Tax=Guptibacillus hwajinpoensis TaxID=208199 RepID=UPI003CD0D46F
MKEPFYTGILLYPRFSEYELSVLLSVLKQGGKQTIFLGLNSHPIRGEASYYPLKEYMESDGSLKERGKMIRFYHDSSAHRQSNA